jgi:hypothetical protein
MSNRWAYELCGTTVSTKHRIKRREHCYRRTATTRWPRRHARPVARKKTALGQLQWRGMTRAVSDDAQRRSMASSKIEWAEMAWRRWIWPAHVGCVATEQRRKRARAAAASRENGKAGHGRAFQQLRELAHADGHVSRREKAWERPWQHRWQWERGEEKVKQSTSVTVTTKTTSFFHFFKITHNFIWKLQKLPTWKLFKIRRATTLLLGSPPNSKQFWNWIFKFWIWI